MLGIDGPGRGKFAGHGLNKASRGRAPDDRTDEPTDEFIPALEKPENGNGTEPEAEGAVVENNRPSRIGVEVRFPT